MSDDTLHDQSRNRPALRRRRKWLRRTGIGLGIVVLLVVLALTWLLGTTSGLRFALSQAESATHGALSVQQANGRLAGTVDLRGLHYATSTGTDVRISRIRTRVKLWALLGKRLHVSRLDIGSVRVKLPVNPPRTPAKTSSFSLRPSIGIELDQAHVGPIHVSKGNKTLFQADSLAAALTWTRHRFAIRQLALRAPAGRVDLHGTLALDQNYHGKANGRFRWTQGQKTYAGTLSAHGNAGNAQLALRLTAPTAVQLHGTLRKTGSNQWLAHLEAPSFNPAPLAGTASLKQLALDLTARGNTHAATVQGHLTVNHYQLNIAPLALALANGGKRIKLQQLHVTSPQIKGALDAHGTLALDAQPATVNLNMRWKGVRVPPALAGQALASNGQITAQGSAQHFQAKGHVNIGPPGQLIALTLDLAGTPQRVTLHTLDLNQPHGKLAVNGTLDLKPAIGWTLHAQADHFNPGLLLAKWHGAIDASLDTQGQLAKRGPHGTLELHKLDGTLRHRDIAGHGKLELHANRTVDGRLALKSGSSSVDLHALPGAKNDIRVQLAVKSLSDWVPDSGGHLDGTVRVRGLWPKLAIRADLNGHALQYRTTLAKVLHLHADIPDIQRPGGTLHVTGADIDAGTQVHIAKLTLNAHGNAAHHTLKLEATGTPASLSLALDGSQRKGIWHGTLNRLNLDVTGMPVWKLTQPAKLAWGKGAGSLSPLCLSPGQPRICVSGKRERSGALEARYQLRALPTQLLLGLAGGDLPFNAKGTLHGQGHIQRSAKGVLNGQATLASTRGSVTYIDKPGQPLLSYSQFQARAQLSPNAQHLRLGADLNDGGRLDGEVTLSGPQHQQVKGQIGLDINNLGVIELLTDTVANLKGKLTARLGVTGTLQKPTLSGVADLDALATEIPAAGLKLHDGQVHLATDNAGQLIVNGHIASGKGTLHIKGATGLSANATTHINISGDNVLVADIPAAKVIVTPDFTVNRSAKLLKVTGKIHVDHAHVKLDKLPGAGATKASPDVVVVDAKQENKAKALPVSVHVTASLGKDTHLQGFGLKARLSGSLIVDEQPGHATTGRGQIVVNGSYTAYGQDLHIDNGRLLFAGTPISNPGLDMRATRSLNPNATIDQGQVVGLKITGTAQNPHATIFSNPLMSQSDALSYMMTGKPLSEVHGGEGSAVTGAAQALGSAAGDLLSKSIGSKLGISDIGVSNSEALGGSSAFTVGKYLSPRLYLSYGVGLFEPGQVITLRYRLSHRWNFEAENATSFNRAAFNYRYEK